MSIFNEEGHATNLLDENVDFGLRSHDMLYALTNVEKQYGASMITQPEVLNKLEQLFPEGFYVLPSSVHEVLIVPDNGEMEPKMLGEMVREVNKMKWNDRKFSQTEFTATIKKNTRFVRNQILYRK